MDLSFTWSLSARTSCCCRSSWPSALCWRWAAAAPAGWRPPGSSRRGSLRLCCALMEPKGKTHTVSRWVRRRQGGGLKRGRDEEEKQMMKWRCTPRQSLPFLSPRTCMYIHSFHSVSDMSEAQHDLSLDYKTYTTVIFIRKQQASGQMEVKDTVQKRGGPWEWEELVSWGP